eukprot:TRINITY_DN2956_c1_g1_i1.p1 TRINITY_DN2956_c1_g1~~TRINITY_DN2956_c1_g1_i1.p1  ORF type:complete len:128 (-),score=5.13 TRINITY_DN2956_c1_g1_i1:29-412(-)
MNTDRIREFCVAVDEERRVRANARNEQRQRTQGPPRYQLYPQHYNTQYPQQPQQKGRSAGKDAQGDQRRGILCDRQNKKVLQKAADAPSRCLGKIGHLEKRGYVYLPGFRSAIGTDAMHKIPASNDR